MDELTKMPDVEQDDYAKERTNFTDAYAREKAEKLGCDILLSNPHTLQLDLDDDVAFEKFQRQLELLKELKLIEVKGYEVLASKSGNRHVVIDIDTGFAGMSIKTRILYQALLGSDVKREMLALAGYFNGQENPILLFRPKCKGIDLGDGNFSGCSGTGGDCPTCGR